jgi:hypothetical protein
MMLNFPRIEIGSRMVYLRELKTGEALSLARMPEALLEARLTKFLAAILEDESLALSLSVQERYYLLMQYLSIQDGSPLTTNANFNKYLLIPSQREAWHQSITDDRLTVNHLTGNQAEILESLCEDVADWVLGAMAFQCEISGIDWPLLPSGKAQNSELSTVMRQRIAILENMDQSSFNNLYEQYLVMCDRLSRFIRTGFDSKGITILGGADNDAPARFRASASLGGIIERLGRCLAINC